MKNKAGFDTTGKSHREGKENEDDTIKILNDKKVYSHTVEKRGGTKLKEDAISYLQKLGIKRRRILTVDLMIGEIFQVQ